MFGNLVYNPLVTPQAVDIYFSKLFGTYLFSVATVSMDYNGA